jgi:hypothetical protein
MFVNAKQNPGPDLFLFVDTNNENNRFEGKYCVITCTIRKTLNIRFGKNIGRVHQFFRAFHIFKAVSYRESRIKEKMSFIREKAIKKT